MFDSRLCLPEGFPGHPICQQMGHEQGCPLSWLPCSSLEHKDAQNHGPLRPVLVTPRTVCHLLRWGICPENRKTLGCHLQELTENLELMYSRKMLRLVLGTAVCYSCTYARDKCGFYHFGCFKRKTKQVLSVPRALLYVPELCSLWCDIRCYFISLKRGSCM